MTTASSAVIPDPVAVTPELLAQHSITAEEHSRILAALGRVPSLTELGIYSVMWSEHCSYKSSRVHLKRLPTKSDRVVQGPGENAGIIDVGDGWACAFKIESHNHPSYIEPFQGAATGVGGILRDIFTMGARPLAVMDSLRFGPIEPEPGTEPDLIAKNHSIVEGVVSGIAGYGNCFGVPNLGGETKFEACYSGNPLVNAFALGLVRKDEIFYAKASGTGNPVIYVGAKTGRDGIHGATMASEEFKEGSEQKRPNVQVGDPFMEKLLLEACLEAMKTGAIVGIQDMGAAGLTCSTCEMGARGGVGLNVELDLVPQRETGMTAYEIMLSESQERMLLVAEKGREGEVLRVFTKWGLDAVIVGTVEPEPRLRIRHHGELVADIPNQSLTDDAPLYNRPVGVWKTPIAAEPDHKIRIELAKDRNYTADLKKLLASPNVCSKRWVHEQYDTMVQTNTVQGPGGEAGVMRIKGTGKPDHERGLAMALDGNGRWAYLDPKLGAMHAVAEAARKVACTGATPVAATNCLNFGNPEKPEIMAPLSARPSPAATYPYITKPAAKESIPRPCLALSASSTTSPKPFPTISSGRATPSCFSGPFHAASSPTPISRFSSIRRPSANTSFPSTSPSPLPKKHPTRPKRQPQWRSQPLDLPNMQRWCWAESGDSLRPSTSMPKPTCTPSLPRSPTASCFTRPATSPTAASLSLSPRPHFRWASAQPSSRIRRCLLIPTSASSPNQPLPW
jgi:phosphoribosylformylglycinamidine synthase subunit PurL